MQSIMKDNARTFRAHFEFQNKLQCNHLLTFSSHGLFYKKTNIPDSSLFIFRSMRYLPLTTLQADSHLAKSLTL